MSAALARDERKVVSVLFADIVGSTATGAERDPEEFGAAIRPQLARMRDALELHGGTIEKYIGDAVVAVFGAPVAREDDPERAVRAALAIRESLGKGARVAVNTGEAVVSLGARAELGEELVLGDVINTAFRIEEATPDGAVFVGETTYRATKNAIEYGDRRLVEAKGKPDPVPAWEALSARSPVGSWRERAPVTPLVGRQEELTLVLDTLARTKRHEMVQLVTLMGVPGIGKSRLVAEIRRALEDASDGTRSRRGRCLPYGDGVAFSALDEIVKSEASILETDDAAAAASKLRDSVRGVLTDEKEADWVEAHLRPLLGLETAAGGDRADEAFSAWRRYLEALAESGPLVLVFEDLHWADDGLLEFVEHVAEWSRDAPLLLLCTARPELRERRPSWGGHRNALTIALPPLTRDETDELLSQLLRAATAPDELREALLARAEGNPLYAEEFVRMLVERGLLVRADGGWALSASELPVPDSVQAMIASRIDALPAEEKAVVQAAAVIGPTFWPDAVAAVASAEHEDVARALQRVERRELLRRQRTSTLGGEVEYTFRHGLVRDVAYGQIPRARRAAKHLLAADWVESLGRPEDHAETAAHHYLAALGYTRTFDNDVTPFEERARSALRRAGDHALALNAYGSAAKFFGEALELSPSRDERPELLFCYGKALSRSSTPDEAVLLEALDAMSAAGDAERAAECRVILGELFWRRGERDVAFEQLNEAVATLADRPASYSKAYAFSTLSRFHIAADEAGPAVDVARTATALAEELGLDELRADAINTIGVARATTGDDGGLADLERSIEIAENVNSPKSIRGYFNLGGMLANLGDLRRAAELHAQGRQVAERFGDASWSEWFDAERVYQEYWAGNWEDALTLAHQLIARAERGGARRAGLDGCLVRGWIALARGDVAQALADADGARRFAVGAADPQNVYPALAFEARALAAAGRDEEAAERVDELLQHMGQQPSLPSFWVLDLAIVLAERDRGDELALASATARTTRWLDAAQAYVDGDRVAAADLCAEIGALPEEAYARLAAGESALASGTRSTAAAQLGRAIEFYRRVGAVAYCRRAEALLAG